MVQRKSEIASNNGSDGVLIDLREITKTYEVAAGTFTALHGVSLQVKNREFLAVVGRSGSGKSTLLNMLTGIDRPTAGEIFINDTALHDLNEDQMALWRGRNVGIVFQFFQLLPTLTVTENVMLAMDFANVVPVRQRRNRTLALLEQVGIGDQANKLPAALSGGQQQRVAIARALANDPPIVVADEPTGNLDTRTAQTVLQLFVDLVGMGKTLLVVTHERDIARWVDRTIVLEDGQIISDEANGVQSSLNVVEVSHA